MNKAYTLGLIAAAAQAVNIQAEDTVINGDILGDVVITVTAGADGDGDGDGNGCCCDQGAGGNNQCDYLEIFS